MKIYKYCLLWNGTEAREVTRTVYPHFERFVDNPDIVHTTRY